MIVIRKALIILKVTIEPDRKEERFFSLVTLITPTGTTHFDLQSSQFAIGDSRLNIELVTLDTYTPDTAT